MPRKLGNVARSILVNAPLPTATKTYTVISHQFVINNIQQHLADNGFTVKHELYKCTKDAQEAIGKFIVDYNNDPDLSMMYAFVNSYNKMIRFGATFGVYVHESESFMIGKLGDWVRKHTGTADQETSDKIEEQISNAKDYYDELATNKAAMQKIEITQDKYASLLGIFFMRGWMTIDMVSRAVKEFNSPSYTYSTPVDNLWTCYNHILVALRQSNPRVWLSNQSAIHLFMCLEFDLAQFDEEETADENVCKDTETTQEENNRMHSKVLLPPQGGPEITGIPNGDTMSDTSDDDEDFITDEMEDVEMDKLLTPIDPIDKDSSDQTVKNLRSEEVTDTKDVQFIPKDNVTEEDICSEEFTYVNVNEYPGVEIGDIVDIDECYYEVFSVEDMEGDRYFGIKPVETKEVEEKYVGEVVEETDALPAAEDYESIVIPSTGVEFNIEEGSEEVVEEVEDNTHLPQEEEVVEDNNVRVTIAKELSELYGYNPEFTFEQKDDVYSITLQTGENVVLATDYVHSMMVNE
tara:strand:- start:3249 stop:4811 length:1563 start_codon:yes stop_codon:yes gene_type:complete